MGESPHAFEVTQSALDDLDEIDDYWCRNGQSDRGEKYVRDLTAIALADLSIPYRARLGKVVKSAVLPDTLGIRVFKSSYRIIYRIGEDHHTVHVHATPSLDDYTSFFAWQAGVCCSHRRKHRFYRSGRLPHLFDHRPRLAIASRPHIASGSAND